MDDKRRAPRKKAIYYLEVFNDETGLSLGRMVDLTAGGMLLISENPIAPNGHYKMRMRLPRKIKGAEEIVFDAVSAWCRESKNSDFIETGFRFVELPQETLEIIELLNKYYAFKD